MDEDSSADVHFRNGIGASEVLAAWPPNPVGVASAALRDGSRAVRCEAESEARREEQDRKHRMRTQQLARRHADRQAEREGGMAAAHYMNPRERRRHVLGARLARANGRRADYIDRFVARRVDLYASEEDDDYDEAVVAAKAAEEERAASIVERAIAQAAEQKAAADAQRAEAEAREQAAAAAEAAAAVAVEAKERRRLRELYHSRVPSEERGQLKEGAELLLDRTVPSPYDEHGDEDA